MLRCTIPLHQSKLIDLNFIFFMYQSTPKNILLWDKEHRDVIKKTVTIKNSKNIFFNDLKVKIMKVFTLYFFK
jgi:hypothetical protein